MKGSGSPKLFIALAGLAGGSFTSLLSFLVLLSTATYEEAFTLARACFLSSCATSLAIYLFMWAGEAVHDWYYSRRDGGRPRG